MMVLPPVELCGGLTDDLSEPELDAESVPDDVAVVLVDGYGVTSMLPSMNSMG